MESIKKLEEQLMMNPPKHGSGKLMNGPKDGDPVLASGKEV